MAITDIIVLVASLCLLGMGFARGFIQSLIGPFSVVVTTYLSVLYYQSTGDMSASLLIGLVGPLVLNLSLRFAFNKWTKDSNRRVRPNALSCLLGGMLTLAWGWVFIIFVLILLNVIPSWGDRLKTLHEDAAGSYTYRFIVLPLEKHYFAASKGDVAAVATAASSSDTRSLADDPRFQAILKDPEIQQEVRAHDISKLMANPKMMDLVQQIMSDPTTMKKVLNIAKNP